MTHRTRRVPRLAPSLSTHRLPACRSSVAWRPGRSRSALLLVAIAVALALVAPTATAHDFWIEPGDFTPALGRPVGVELRVGVSFPGGQVARRDAHTLRFASLGPSGETALPGVEGTAPAGIFQPSDAGDHVLVFRGDDSAISLPAEEFEAYLAEEGLERVAAERAERGEDEEPGRELYSRSVKSLVTVRPAAPPASEAATALTPSAGSPAAAETASSHLQAAGLDLELVPAARPADLAVGDPLTVRLLWHGKALAGAMVRAESAATGGTAQAVRSGDDGSATFRLDASGVWKIATVHMERVDEASPQAADAEWRSVWTSLTFAIPADAGSKAAMPVSGASNVDTLVAPTSGGRR